MVMFVNPALVRSSRSFWLKWPGVCCALVAFWLLVDPVGATAVAATAEPAKPQLKRTAHKVLLKAVIGFDPSSSASQRYYNHEISRSFLYQTVNFS